MLGRFTAIFEKGDKHYIGYCPEVPGANGQGETINECRESLAEAIKLILQDRLEDGWLKRSAAGWAYPGPANEKIWQRHNKR